MSRSSSERSRAPQRAAPPGAENGRAASLAPIVERLTQIGETDHWVVSCYLKLEPRDRTRGKYLIKLKNRIKQQLAAFEQRPVDRAARQVVERDLQRIREHLEHPSNLPAGRGIAIFACEALDLFEVIPLAQVFRSRLAIAHSPLVRELAALDDEFGRVICAVSDRTTARFFDITICEAVELPPLRVEDATRPGRFHGPSAPRSRGETQGRGIGASAHGEHNFNQRIREEKHRHYAQVAQRLFALSRNGDVTGIVLAGMGADIAAVEPHLHPYTREALLGTAKVNPKRATVHDVVEAVLAVRSRREREWEARHVAELEESVGSGWAVNGITETLDALARGQVRTLLVDPTTERDGYRCLTSGHLVLEPDACAEQGTPEPVADVIDEAIEDALRQGSHVDVVEDPDLHGRVDGLAALFRFKVA